MELTTAPADTHNGDTRARSRHTFETIKGSSDILSLSTTRPPTGISSHYDEHSKPSFLERLPEATILLIFMEVINCSSNSELVLSPKYPSVIVSRVCREWEKLALSEPRLWSRWAFIALSTAGSCEPTDGRSPISSTHLLELQSMVKIWTARSKGRGLSVVLQVHVSGEHIKELRKEDIKSLLRACRDLINIPCTVSVRWEEVNIRVLLEHVPNDYRGWCAEPLLSLQPKDVPSLQRVHIKLHGWHPYEALPAKENGFQMGSQVRILVMPSTGSTLKDYHAPWSSLTELRCMGFFYMPDEGAMETLKPRTALTLLGMCPNLAECHLYIFDSPEPRNRVLGGVEATVTLSQLRVLCLKGIRGDTLLASFLSLPSLQDLRFFPCESGTIHPESLKCWLTHFGGHLKALRFDAEPSVEGYTPEDMIAILGQVPNLRVLRTRLGSNDSQLCQALTPRGTGAMDRLCPYLRELVLDDTSGLITLNEMVELLRSRSTAELRNAGVPILTDLRFRTTIPSACRVERELINLGVDLVGVRIHIDLKFNDPGPSEKYRKEEDVYDLWVDRGVDEMWGPYKYFGSVDAFSSLCI
ncbi:hypothetical protein NMY22_g8812 [Coprinellus aureogranulatus]|nr:hypothetical protein NMY22_g8812 [Coprinellus aureogranulatus]